jgi:sRNA-binding protein
LAARFPKTFSVWEGARRPLKLGVRDDVAAACPIPRSQLNAGMGHYVGSTGYLRAI